MGTECLCQVYLTTIFNQAEKNPNFQAAKDQLDLRFEQLHRGEVEAEHRRQMRLRIGALILESPNEFEQLKAGYEDARKSFHIFFKNIYDHIGQSGHSEFRSEQQLDSHTNLTSQ